MPEFAATSSFSRTSAGNTDEAAGLKNTPPTDMAKATAYTATGASCHTANTNASDTAQVRADHHPNAGPPVPKRSGHRCQQEHRQDFGDHDAADAHTGPRQVVDKERKSDEVERVPPLGDRPGNPQPSIAGLRHHLAQPRPGVPRSHFRNDEAAIKPRCLTVRRRVVALLRVDSHGRRIPRGLAILAADARRDFPCTAQGTQGVGGGNRDQRTRAVVIAKS